MKNNNQKVIRRLSSRSLKNRRVRNAFAIIAIALTCTLFTALASMGIGMMQVMQEQTMREVGGKFHAGLKNATKEQMEAVVEDDRVVSYSWNQLISVLDNIIKRSAELRYPQGEQELENCFIELENGRLPQKEDEIVVDTIVLDELNLPHETGVQFPAVFDFQGETIKKTFTVSGWYQGDFVSHASQLYVSEAYWDSLKGDLTDEDFVAWGEKNPQDKSVGLYSVGLYFKNDKNIEETVRSVIKDAGYDPDHELTYGVNWAYMGSRMENIDPLTVVLLGAVLVVVLVTGYLIIYNIFQISVISEIRFYGLLKTIGATKKQIKRLIRIQALVLSAIGIPIGLLFGYATSCGLFPVMMSISDYQGMKIALHFDPMILLFGIVFSLLTVLISCRRPGKIAGSVSPIEAVRYSERSVKRKKQKKSETGARVHRMALSNLGRNKKKTVFVVLSLSLSVSILCIVLTAVGSFRIDRYLESRLVGDVTVGSTNYTASKISPAGFQIDEEMLEQLDAQPGIVERNEMWAQGYSIEVVLSDEAYARYSDYYAQGKFRSADAIDKSKIEDMIARKKIWTDAYGYDDELLEKLTVIRGELDIKKFQKGDYILVSPVIGDTAEDCILYEPGDKITLEMPAPDTEWVEERTQSGELISVTPKETIQKEYEVMAVTAEAPSAMDQHLYSVAGVQLILLKREMLPEQKQNGYCFAVSYTLEEDALPAFIDTVKHYTEKVNPYMGYLTKETLVEEFSGMINVVQTIGVALCIVIAVIGVLNFINSIMTGIISRKRELATLNSIGMTQRQIRRMLIEEGLYYVLISGIVSLILGSSLAYALLYALNNVILFFEYRYNALAFLIMLPVFGVIAVLAPDAAYKKAAKESVVERLRETES